MRTAVTCSMNLLSTSSVSRPDDPKSTTVGQFATAQRRAVHTEEPLWGWPTRSHDPLPRCVTQYEKAARVLHQIASRARQIVVIADAVLICGCWISEITGCRKRLPRDEHPERLHALFEYRLAPQPVCAPVPDAVSTNCGLTDILCSFRRCQSPERNTRRVRWLHQDYLKISPVFISSASVDRSSSSPHRLCAKG